MFSPASRFETHMRRSYARRFMARGLNFLRCVLLLGFCGSAPAEERYSDAMFRRALAENGSAPLYVLITLRDAKTGAERPLCTEAPFLRGAVALENDLCACAADEAKVAALALAAPGRVFTFHDSSALENLHSAYDAALLAKISAQLAAQSSVSLRAELAAAESPLHQLYRFRGDWREVDAYREAIACVLLSRGILVGRSDSKDGSRLYLAK